MNYNRERGGNPSFGWPHPDFLSRGSATQHAGFVSRPVDVHPSTSWDLPFQQQGCTGFQQYEGPTPTSWDHPTTRVGEFHVPCSYWEPTAPRGTSTQVTSSVPLSPPSSASSPYEFDPILGRPRTSWDLPRPRIAPKSCSNPSDWNYSDPYAYDSPFRRPLTSWDLPSPRFESYGGGGSSQYEYGASENPGGGSYSPYSNYGGGYSGGRYVNEPNPYVPPPPPPREDDYVLAPQPNPPFSLPEWRFPTWDLGSHQATTPAAPILAPSLPAVQHQLQPLPAPWATPPPPSRDGCYVPPPPPYTPPQQSQGSSCFLTAPNGARDTTAAGRERERGVSGKVEEESLMVEEENKGEEATIEVNVMDELERSTTPLENEEEFMGDESEEAPVYDVRKKTLGLADELMVCEFVVAKEGEELVVERASVYSNCGWAVLHPVQEEVVLLGVISNKKGEGSLKRELKSREVSRRSVVFGIYALEEVYKKFLYLHLEDKVILKGGGVDTLFIFSI